MYSGETKFLTYSHVVEVDVHKSVSCLDQVLFEAGALVIEALVCA